MRHFQCFSGFLNLFSVGFSRFLNPWKSSVGASVEDKTPRKLVSFCSDSCIWRPALESGSAWGGLCHPSAACSCVSAPPPPTPLQPVSFPSPPPPDTRRLWGSELLLRNHPDLLCRWLSTTPACFPAGRADLRPWHLGAPQGALVRFGSLVTCRVQARSGFGRLGAVVGPPEQACAVWPPSPATAELFRSWLGRLSSPARFQAGRPPPPCLPSASDPPLLRHVPGLE